MSNLITILGESKWNRAAQRWDRADAPARAFQFAVDGPADVHHTVLSRADGAVDLLLWQEVPSFDLKTRKDIANAPVPVTIRLRSPAGAALYRPLAGTEPQQRWNPSDSFTLVVPDEVVILRLSGVVPAGDVPAATSNLTASTTATSARLHWKSAGALPVAFIVSRNGQYLATVTPPSDGSASFAEDALIPGIGFPYTVCAVGRNGLLSAPATVVARTVNQRPDLVVQSLACEPAHPKPGDEVRFVMTIANIGVAPTPAVTHGVGVCVDGQIVCWSGSSSEPLAPGATRRLSTNSGPAGKSTWTCTVGSFQVVATVDDINRIDESNEQNNRSSVLVIDAK